MTGVKAEVVYWLLCTWTVSWRLQEQPPWSSMKTYKTLLSSKASKAKS